MAEITAATIRDLREKTGAGMMDCKKALEESQGDIEKAVEWLRKKGLSSAAKRAGKAAKEGVVIAKVTAKSATLAEINCETDFVARNEGFQKFAQTIVDAVDAAAPGSKDAFLTGSQIEGVTAQEFIAANASKMGENVQLTRFDRFAATGPVIFESYIHSNAKIGVIVEIACGSDAVAANADLKQFAKDLVLHIAAEAPLFLNREGAPADVVEKEKDIARTQLRQQGKPEAMLDKIVTGKIEKYYSEVALLEQKFFRGDNPPAVQKLLADKAKAAGGEAKITRFVRYVLGETAPKETEA